VKVVFARPPMFAEIDKVFAVAGKPVIFAFGDTIYNPEGITVTPALMAHETVHGERQGLDPEHWWRRYLGEPAFRLAEEIPAHRAEHIAYCRAHKDRNAQARYLFGCSSRLASPLYGGLISRADAAASIQRRAL
jgi:hypothetical protein